MPESANPMSRRVLVIDDNPRIFEDFQTILGGTADISDLDTVHAELFGGERRHAAPDRRYHLDYASQGQEGYDKVTHALQNGQPYQLAFVDMRMPPGWDGLETIASIWQVDPQLQIVLCTAYSDYGWEEIRARLGATDALLILKKPFDVAEVAQLASALTEKWHLARQAALQMEELDRKVAERTAALQRINDQLHAEITERKEAEKALRESEERFTHFMGHLPGVAFMKDVDGRHVFVNKQFEDLFHLSHDAWYGKTNADLFPPEVARQFTENDQLVLTKNSSLEAEERVLQDGVTSYWLVYKFPIPGSKGSPTLLGGIGIDITERKRLEDHLRQAQKMEAMGTLAGGIAHDFNNILSAIFGYTQMASSDISQDSLPWRYLQEVFQASRRAKDLVEQILAFSRQSETERHPVQLQLVVTEALRLLRASLPTTIDIQHHLSTDGGTVAADPTQMHQVIMNLCTNAEHAMRETGGILEVHLHAIEVDEAFHPALAPGPHLRLTIRDTGHGMEPAVLERMFDPFFTTKGVGEGTGLGLAVVHGIIAKHGGALTVESTLGEGTTFAIYLPQIEAPTAPADRIEAPLLHGTGCILFVDDEVMLANLGKAGLEPLGYEVVSHTSSLAAFEAFRSNPQRFDLVITDQTMPQLTGEQLATALRRIRPDIPIIVCTGFSHVINAEKAQALGIDAFCMKPLLMRELAVTIQQVLDKRSGQVAQPGARILLIDDDDQLRVMLGYMLEAAGYEVIDASDGRQGVQRYRDAPTDVIITDLIMPEQEGLETIMELRRDFPGVKIIAISGGAKTGTRDFLPVAQKLGAQRVLRKPFAQDELLTAIQEVLRT